MVVIVGLGFSVAAGLAPTTARAGGWARPAGSVYVRSGVALFRGQGAFLVAEDVTGEFYSLAAELYTEVGIGKNLEADISLRWVDNVNELNDGSTLRERGLEDLEVRLEWAPVNKGQALAFVVGFRQSLYDRRPLDEMVDGRPQRGPGGTDLLVGASYGYSFFPDSAWLTADVLLRLRLQNPSSAVLTRVEAGWMVFERLGVAGFFELQPAFGRDEDLELDAPAPVPTALGFGAKLLVPVHAGFGLSAEAIGWPDVLNDGPGYRLGLSLTYER